MSKFMKTKVIKYLFLAALLITGVMIKPGTCSAAETKVHNKVDGIIELSAKKAYYYDLNNDGIDDKIYFEFTCNEKTYSTIVKLYINDSMVYTSLENHDLVYQLQLCDLDTSDNYLDLYLFSRMESDGIYNCSFIHYNGKGITENTGLKPEKLRKFFKHYDIYRYSIANVKGNNKFDVILDTPILSNSIGCYNCYVPFQIKNKVISNEPVYTYTLTQGSKDYKYKALKSFNAYVKVGSKSVSFKVVKGAVVKFDKVYVTKNGTLYARVIGSKGQKGWINAGQKDLFKEIPLWG